MIQLFFSIGRVFLRQASEDPLSETMVYIESLIYSDGSVNSTNNHQLEIHTNLPGLDFHDWQSRCQSTGSIYNPFKVLYQNNSNFLHLRKTFVNEGSS